MWQNWQSSISVFWRPNSYSRILHVKSVQNTEVPYWLAALHYLRQNWLRSMSTYMASLHHNKIAIWGWQTPQLPRPEKAPKIPRTVLSNMLRPTFVPNLVVLTWTRASAALDWLTLPLSIKTTRPDPPPPTPPLHPHPTSKFKPNSTARSNRFSSGTPCVTLWNSLCSIPVTWVSTHNY